MRYQLLMQLFIASDGIYQSLRNINTENILHLQDEIPKIILFEEKNGALLLFPHPALHGHEDRATEIDLLPVIIDKSHRVIGDFDIHV